MPPFARWRRGRSSRPSAGGGGGACKFRNFTFAEDGSRGIWDLPGSLFRRFRFSRNLSDLFLRSFSLSSPSRGSVRGPGFLAFRPLLFSAALLLRLPSQEFPPEECDRAAPLFCGAFPARFARKGAPLRALPLFSSLFRVVSAAGPLLDRPFRPVSPFGLYWPGGAFPPPIHSLLRMKCFLSLDPTRGSPLNFILNI